MHSLGVKRYSKLIIIELMPTDLPEPVVPGIVAQRREEFNKMIEAEKKKEENEEVVIKKKEEDVIKMKQEIQIQMEKQKQSGNKTELICKNPPVMTIVKDENKRNMDLNTFNGLTPIGEEYVPLMKSFPDKNGVIRDGLLCESPFIRENRSDKQKTIKNVTILMHPYNILGEGNDMWTPAPNINFLEQNYNLFDQESKAFFDVNKSYLINHENKVLHKDDNNNIAYVRYNSDEIDLTDYNIKKGIFGDLSDSVMEETIDKYFPSKESLGEKWNCIPTKYVYKCQE